MPTATVVEGSGETVTNDSQAVLQPTTSTYNDIEQSYWLWHDGAVSDGSVAAFHGEAFFSLYRWRMWRRAHLLGPVAFSLNTEKTSGHRRVPFDGRTPFSTFRRIYWQWLNNDLLWGRVG